jgi:hypothetical protein
MAALFKAYAAFFHLKTLMVLTIRLERGFRRLKAHLRPYRAPYYQINNSRTAERIFKKFGTD